MSDGQTVRKKSHRLHDKGEDVPTDQLPVNL